MQANGVRLHVPRGACPVGLHRRRWAASQSARVGAVGGQHAYARGDGASIVGPLLLRTLWKRA
eukprot:scaffold17650_cov102-Isochrysis_galbana.AAC.2